MDPASLTFGVVGLVVTALAATRSLKTLIGDVRDAPAALSSLSNDTQALAAALEALQVIIHEGQTRFTPAQARLVTLLKAPLENCNSAVQDIHTVLRPFFSETKEGTKLDRWHSLKLTFKKGELTMLQNTLIAYKQSLDIAISVVSFSTITDGFDDFKQSVGHVKDQIRDLQENIDENQRSEANACSEGSQTAGTDYGFALRKFLLETESVVDELPSDDAPDPAIDPFMTLSESEQDDLLGPSMAEWLRLSMAEHLDDFYPVLDIPIWGFHTLVGVKQYWLLLTGLSKSVLDLKLNRYLGALATCRPYDYRGHQGYVINGPVLTKAQVDDLRRLSYDFWITNSHQLG